MSIVYRIVLVVSVFAAIAPSRPVQATTYNVDIFGTLPDGVSYGPDAGIASTNACSATTCAGGSNPVHTFIAQPGDTINFGTLSLSSFIFGDGRSSGDRLYIDEDGILRIGFGMPVALFPGFLSVSVSFRPFPSLFAGFGDECHTADPRCLPRLNSAISVEQFSLLFDLPEGYIQLAWTSPFDYAPPATVGAVPEPSTWVMLLIGFAGLGFAACRRSRAVVTHQTKPVAA